MTASTSDGRENPTNGVSDGVPSSKRRIPRRAHAPKQELDGASLRSVLEDRRDAYRKLGGLVSGAAVCDELLQLLDLPNPRQEVPTARQQAGEQHDDYAAPRERFWTGAPETRLYVSELAAEIGKTRSWIYRHTAKSAEFLLPHKRVGGELDFTRGEVREWFKQLELM